ncbi:hypothetical protein MCP_1231 [Methanocella paludicola SANAE]|uniref:Uncharacterized protein n=2 Tax=Methanocella TaxID=570266 RepID=D1YXY1_METPS|nr:hypothetical protein MCP_1231 [Methanocella paludicola SANAE]
MRIKIIAYLAIAILLASPAASASLVSLTFPAIRPVYAGDTGKLMEAIGGLVEFTNAEVASPGINASTANFPDSSILSDRITSLPGAIELLTALAPPVKPDNAARDNISRTLTGMNLTYYSIAGKPMNYTITADSIKSIEPYPYKGKPAWKVRVGEGLAWDLIMDRSGTKILKTDQLFRT